MKIRCITNLAGDIPAQTIVHYTSLDSVQLVVDKEYIVYALSEYYQSIWYCICDEAYTYHPMWMPKEFFELIDDRISRYWVFSFKKDLDKDRFFLGFSQWANQLDFYDNLTDGEEKEVGIFQAYKKLMDLEFPDSSITEDAQIIDHQWLTCPWCIDGWECSSDRDALVICPKCQKILNNPRYKNRCPGL